MKRVKWTIALCVLTYTTALQSNEPEATPPSSDSHAPKKVLVAARQSEFKSDLVEALVKSYRSRAEMMVVDIKKLGDFDAANFDALVVLGERKGWLMFSGRERRFLRHLKEKNKLVMVMTAADPDWKWDRKDVDVVTGASKTDKLEPLLTEITKRLDAILIPKSP